MHTVFGVSRVPTQQSSNVKSRGVSKKPSVTKKRSTPTPSDDVVEKIAFDPNDVNIFALDRKIHDVLSKEVAKLPELELKLANLRWLSKNAVEPLDKITADKQTEDIRRKIQDLESGALIGWYMVRAEPIMNMYRELQKSEVGKTVTFGASTPRRGVDDNEKKKAELRLDFVRIAKEYLDLSTFQQEAMREMRMTCVSCGATVFQRTEECSYTCAACGVIVCMMEEAPMFPDADRVNMCARYTYSREAHLQDAMACFQGKESTVIPEYVYSIIEEEIRLHKLTPQSVTKSNIVMFLSEQGLKQYYMNVHSIYYKITSKPPPNISEFEQRIIDDHELLESAYERIKSPDRVNSMNVNFKLYKLLLRYHYPCKRTDFLMLKTKTKYDEHEETYAKCCELLGWENVCE